MLTSAVGVVAFFVLADSPERASWLSREDVEILNAEQARSLTAGAGHGSLWQALRAPAVLYLGVIFFIIQMAVYGLVFFMPSQIAVVLGRSVDLRVGLVSMLPWIAALVATIAFPRYADRSGRWIMMATLLLVGAGIGLAGSASVGGAMPVVAALCIAAASFIAVQPIFWSIASRRLPAGNAAASLALINSFGATGSFVAPNLRVASETIFASTSAGVLTLALSCLLGAVLIYLIPRAKVFADVSPSLGNVS